MSHDSTDDPHRFDFDLDRGIREQVVERLEASPILSLEKGVGPISSGIYALYFDEALVYAERHRRGPRRASAR